jgi:TolA-binding protein
MGVLLAWLLPTDAFAQNTIRGTVTDSKGVALSGARVVLTEVTLKLRIEVKSDSDGRFERSAVPSGKYRVECELEGYSYEPTVVQIGGGVPQSTPGIQMVRVQSPRYADGVKALSDGRFAEAVADMQEVLATDPEDQRAHFVVGVSLLEIGRHQEALTHLMRAEKGGGKFAETPMLLVNIGRALLLIGDPQRAETYFARVGDPKAVAAAFADIGNRAFNRGDFVEAAAAYERALKANAIDPDALFGLGLCLVKSEQVSRAVELFRTLVSSAPDHPKAKKAQELLKSLARQ